MKYSLILFALFTFEVHAFNSNFTVANSVPLEFQHLFNSLKTASKTPSDQLQLIGIAKDLDQNLGFLNREQVLLLMKSEVIKNVLEHKFKKVRSFDITSELTNRLEKGFSEKERYLSPFSQWIFRSIIAELKFRESRGLITEKSFQSGNFQGEKYKEAVRFQKYTEYLMPWIDNMDILSATQFNELSQEVSWIILRRLNERALLFKRYSSTSVGNTKQILFNIPQKLLEMKPEDIKAMQNDETPMTLKEESAKRKNEAEDKVEKISPEDLSPLSDDVAKELEKKQ